MVRSSLRIIVASVIGGLTACTPLLDKPAAETVPQASELAPGWSSDELANSDLVWNEFVDSPALTEIINEAQLNNLDLQVSIARRNAAFEQARIASGRRWPAVSAALDGNRQQRASTAFTTAGSAITETVSGNVSASWEVDLWGELALGQKAAINTALQQQQLLRWSQFSLSAQIARTWLDSIESQQQWRLAQQREKNLRDNLDIIENGFGAGIRDALDVYSARAEADASQANTVLRQQNYQSLVRQLEVLLGRYPGNTMTLPGSAPALRMDIPKQLPLTLLERRPDVVAGRHALIGQQANLGVAKANRLPALNLRGSYGASNRSLRDVLDGDDIFWSAVAGITAPLFQGGQLAAEQRRQMALLNANAAEYKSTLLTAISEVEQSIDNEILFKERLAAARRADQISQQAEQQAFESYVAGLSNLNTWLQAQRTAFDRQSQLLQLETELLKNRIGFYLALGGDFGVSASTEQTP
ncbi:MAG: efflux transporter outer membrane subunit [Pseudomonadales bacterium]